MTPMMLRHFPTSPWEGLDAPSAALLLGIQRDPGPPVQFGPHRFERLRIVIIDRDPTDGESDDDNDSADGREEPEILQQLPMLRRGALPPSRPVHGEILRGEDGALYERFGQRIRPLRALATGPRGEVLEIAAAPVKPGADKRPAERAPAPAPAPMPTPEPVEAAAPAPEPEPPPAPAVPVRALFAAPGHWRVVRLGDFRGALTAQLAEPARLRDTHWLPCHVQVFEATPPQSREALAAMALGDAQRATELIPVTPPLVHALQLAAVLPPPVRGTARFVHLCLAHDPTDLDEPAPAPAAAPVAPAPVAAAPVAPPPAAPPPPPAPPPGPKTEIPAALLQTAPFVLSREAAYADLAADDHARASRLRRWFGTEPRITEPALREWQLQLSGRSLDEQLWAVPPPTGWRRDDGVLAWAAHALERGGYTPTLLQEWRLFWRRRGC